MAGFECHSYRFSPLFFVQIVSMVLTVFRSFQGSLSIGEQ
jgi:hypothetical protein